MHRLAFVQLPREIAHCFQNTGNVDAKFLMLAVPAGWEQFFEEAFYLATDCPDALPPTTGAFMARGIAAAPQGQTWSLFRRPPQQLVTPYAKGNSPVVERMGPVDVFSRATADNRVVPHALSCVSLYFFFSMAAAY